MNRVAILIALALLLPVGGCTDTPRSVNVTTSNGNWEAVLLNGTGQASLLNFVVDFSVTDTTGNANEPLDITGFSFFNQGSCFTNGHDAESYSGEATLDTSASGLVTGTLNMSITSSTNGSMLTLQGNLTGTSNGTTTTTGTLSNAVVTGTWSLTPGKDATGCNAVVSEPFIMCQGAATCSTTTTPSESPKRPEDTHNL
ncbi:MAG TPA: hypothetical protein VMD76_00785 [Candidatus Sulfotelmatobacter sp.]|nr:hypothetical protein [Candidatus Sulfotelmatobacter sp.]